jgi:RimJ/RimL family protein N-acetyltransferase
MPLELHSENLLLRPFVRDDAVAMHRVYSDPEAMKYWSSPPVTELAQAEALVSADMACMAEGQGLFWALTLADSGQVVGKCTLFGVSASNRRAEVGYILDRRFWGRGLMTEAMCAMLDFGFGQLGLHRLEADSDPDNGASLALLEKLGFRREGLFRQRWNIDGEWRDSVMLGLLGTEWATLRQPAPPGA